MTEALTAAHAALLARVDLFSGLDRIALARLAASAEPLSIGVDADVCTEGASADGLYVVVRGTFSVLKADPETDRQRRIGTLGPGDVFGELALLNDEPRSATVRGDTGGEVLRLERNRMLDMLESEPSIALAIAARLSRLVREKDRGAIDDQMTPSQLVEATLAMLPVPLHDQVLEASVLVDPSPACLHALFGPGGDQVGQVLESLGARAGPRAADVRGELRARLARAVGADGIERAAEAASQHLLRAGHIEDALQVLDHHGLHPAFERALAEVLRSNPQLAPDRQSYWLSRVVADEDRSLSSELARRSKGGAARDRGRWKNATALAIATGCVGLAGVLGLGGASAPATTFALLLTAAVVLWMANVVPSSVVGLGLVVGWVLSGIASAQQAAAGFASLDWLFVLAVFAMSGAVAGSGLLFRVGLLLVRRLPDSLFWQSGALLFTGILLTPLLPSSTGRAAITEPFALTIADTLRLRDRSPAAAVLGLAAWIGAGPLRFLFLSGSSMCLLAWGMLPVDTRARFDWITWFLAALPLGVMVAVGGLLMLFVVFRPERPAATVRGRLDVQLWVLGPLSRRELAMSVILLVTMCGWIAAPLLRMDIAVIALLGVLGAAATGNLGRRELQSLDWDYLVFYGTALSLVRLGSAIGIDRMVGDAIGAQITGLGLGPLWLVLAIAAVSVAVCQALGPDQSVLLLALALVPSAPAFGLNPWVIVITILAGMGVWLIPSQMPMYLGAYAASEGRLFSPRQSQRAALGFLAVLLIGLTVSVPVWGAFGLL